MKVLLPAHRAGAAGIGTFVRGLATSLPAALGDADVLTLVGGPGIADDDPRVRRLQPGRTADSRLARVLYEQLYLARLASGVDVVHLPDHRPLLLSNRRSVMTVHDVSYLDHPEFFPPATARYKRLMLRAAARRRNVVYVCDSRYSAERLEHHHPAAAGRVRVIHPGVEPAPDLPPFPEPEQPFFLTLSTLEARKNHATLLEGFRRARRDGLRLRWKVAGGPGYRSEEIEPALRATDGVEVLGRVSDAAREQLLRQALFVATPSHLEGFGYPALEAMARGTPTVTSAGHAHGEILGDATLSVPARDADAWARALLMLASDGDQRARLSRDGARQVSRFNWRSAAERYVETYRDTLAAD